MSLPGLVFRGERCTEKVLNDLDRYDNWLLFVNGKLGSQFDPMSINSQMSFQEGMCYYLFLIRFLLSFPFILNARIRIFNIMQLEREFVVSR